MTTPSNTTLDVGSPFSQEAEEATIGAVLIDPSKFVQLRGFLEPSDFFLLRHEHIWKAFCYLDDKKQPIDLILLAERLENVGVLDNIGGRAYLVQLLNNAGTSVYAEVYGRLVEKTAISRKGLIIADELKKGLLDESKIRQDVLTDSLNKLLDISTSSDSGMQTIFDSVLRHMDKIEERRANPNSIIGIPTGYSLFDFISRGLQDDRLYVFGGQSGIGKSAWMANLALRIAKSKKSNGDLYKVGWFSYENTEHETITRFASIQSDIDAKRIESGTTTDKENRLYLDACGVIGNTSLFITDNMAITAMQLRALCRKMKYQHGLDIIFVDYLQLIPSGGEYSKREAEVNYIVKTLKLIAKELHIPVITAAQINRENVKRNNHKPNMSDLRESASIEQTADMVAFIHSDAYYYQNSEDDDERALFTADIWDASINVVKHRNGGTGECEMKFKRSCTKFLEVVPDPFANSADTPETKQNKRDHYATNL